MDPDLAVLLADDDVGHVVGRRVVGPREELHDGVAPVPHLGHPDARVVEHGVLREQLVEAVPLPGVDHVAVLPEELVDLDEVDGLHAASAQLGVRAGSAAAWQPARYP